MAIINLKTVLLALFTTISIQLCGSVRYEPTWESLDKRPLPDWYDDVKFGIFITWGVFSVPSFKTEWFWNFWKTGHPDYVAFMKKNYPPSFTYPDFAKDFTTEFYDANQWADIIEASGAKYITILTKHHDGFTNYPSNHSFNWNSMAVGPKRDLIGEMAAAIAKKPDIHFGIYHSLFEWFNPIFLQDQTNGFKTQRFVAEKAMPELYEIVHKYKPEVIWSDGDWMAPSKYWNSTEFIAWLYNESPVKDTVVTNDRWGSECSCHHGGVYTCHDRYNPGKLQSHKWENAMTIDVASWGFRRDAQLDGYLNMEDLTKTLAETVSCGGNLLMNVGPTKDGRFDVIYEERLRQMGSWLKVNGEAIYGSKPWTHQNDTITPNVWYTMKKSSSSVYAIVLDWPKTDILSLGAINPNQNIKISLLGYTKQTFTYQKRQGGGIDVQIHPIPYNDMPCKWAWVFKIVGLM